MTNYRSEMLKSLRSLGLIPDNTLSHRFISFAYAAQQRRFDQSRSTETQLTRTTAFVVALRLSRRISSICKRATLQTEAFCAEVGLKSIPKPQSVNDVVLHETMERALKSYATSFAESRRLFSMDSLVLCCLKDAADKGGLFADRLSRHGARAEKLLDALHSALLQQPRGVSATYLLDLPALYSFNSRLLNVFEGAVKESKRLAAMSNDRSKRTQYGKMTSEFLVLYLFHLATSRPSVDDDYSDLRSALKVDSFVLQERLRDIEATNARKEPCSSPAALAPDIPELVARADEIRRSTGGKARLELRHLLGAFLTSAETKASRPKVSKEDATEDVKKDQANHNPVRKKAARKVSKQPRGSHLKKR